MPILAPSGAGLVLAALTLAAPLAAQDPARASLAGTWTLDLTQSSLGGVPVHQRTDIISVSASELTITRTAKHVGGGEPVSYLYHLDGTPSQNSLGDNLLESTVRWAGDTLVIETSADTPQGPVQLHDRFTVSRDGDTLRQERHAEVMGQAIDQVLLSRRKP